MSSTAEYRIPAVYGRSTPDRSADDDWAEPLANSIFTAIAGKLKLVVTEVPR